MISKVDDEKAIEVSVLVEKLDGEVLFDYRSKRNLTLASNTKLFTTSAALLELGADFRWHTRALRYKNDLAIVGDGDPSLYRTASGVDAAQELVVELLQSLRAVQVSKIETLYIDGSIFSDQRHPLWPLEHSYDYFCAPPTALSVNTSCIDIDYDGRAPSFYPALGKSIKIAHYGKPSSFLSAWWADEGSTLWLRLPSAKQSAVAASAKYAVPDGLEFFGWWLNDQLTESGISVEQIVIAEKPNWPHETVLLDFESKLNLSDVVHQINKESNNFMAEMVLKKLGSVNNSHGSFAAGVSAVKNILLERLPSVAQLSQIDGSGMARSTAINNSASPKLLCDLLRMMCFEPQGVDWFDSLAVGGLDGTISSRFTDAVFQPQRIHAKTGFIYSKQSTDGSGASSLSGYLLLPDNEIAVFSFLVNFQRKINTNTNNRRFKSLQQQFLKQLIKEY
ncbi:MAG: D-alanyl-D-alanine carboxypeptidase [Planctomycetes bacterium]|nr:D-alanyl-D-alanine carboxypeptidase [Planctomycetota bacterium]